MKLTGTLAGIVLEVLLASFAHAQVAQPASQTFTLDGRLYSDTAATTPLAEAGVNVDVQILDQSQACILYEEAQVVDTSSTTGYFTIQIGSSTSGAQSLKRGTNDTGNTMAKVYSNVVTSVTGKLVSNSSGCTYNPVSGDQRFLRVTVTPPSGAPQVLSPNVALDSAPSAIVAERAENLQGLLPTDLLQVNTMAPANVSQANLENIFSVTNYTKLTNLLTGGATTTSSDGTAAAPGVTFSGDTGTGFYDASAGVIGVSSSGTGVFNISSSSMASTTTGGALITSANGTAAAPTFSFKGDSGTGWFRPAASVLAASTGGTERIRIDAFGNVGIGTPTPGARLEVSDPTSGSVPLIIDYNANIVTNDPAIGGAGGVDLQNFDTGSTSLGGFTFYAADTGTAQRHGSVILMGKDANWVGGSGNYPGYLAFWTRPPSSGLEVERMRISSNGNVGIGTPSPQASLHVNGTQIGWGHIGLGNNASIDSITLPGWAGSTNYWNSDVNTDNLMIQENSTALSGSSPQITGVASYINANPSADASNALYTGLEADVRSVSSNTQHIGDISGIIAEGDHYGSGNLNYLSGTEADADNYGSATVAEAAGTSVYVGNFALGTITTAYGLWVKMANNGAGSITNSYGVYVDTVDGTNRWSIYASDNAPSYFGGNVGIGTTTPQATLDINGVAKLAVNSAQPAACTATINGTIALTSHSTLCICKGGSTAWVSSTDGTTACTW